MTWRGRVAIVTGGSRGIGRQVAVDLAREGATVVVAARTSSAVEATVASIQGAGGVAVAAPCDVSEVAAATELVARSRAEFGRLDLLVNAAAIAPVGAVDELSADDITRTVQVNLLGTMYTCQAALPIMKTQRSGHLVAFSSHSAHLPMPYAAAYCASKAGVTAFLDALACEVRGTGIRTLVVYPAVVPDTQLAQADIARRGVPPQVAIRTAADISSALLRALQGNRRHLALPRGSALLHVGAAAAPRLAARLT